MSLKVKKINQIFSPYNAKRMTWIIRMGIIEETPVSYK